MTTVYPSAFFANSVLSATYPEAYLAGTPSSRKIKVAALARDASDCTVSNVSVSGTIQTNYDGELPMLNEAFYEGDETVQVIEFVSNITVEKQ